MPPLHTVGHSNRSAAELIRILRGAGIEVLVDVRRYPSSRRHPHFNAGPLADALADAGVAYRHREVLGGYREPSEDSPHGGLERSGFRGYADHMDTDAFRGALTRLLEEADRRKVAVLCAEADPERCHRRMIADAAVARGRRVVHLLDEGSAREHELDERARVRAEGRVLYPPPEDPQRSLFEAG